MTLDCCGYAKGYYVYADCALDRQSCHPGSQQNLLAVLYPQVDAGQDWAVLEIEAADFKLAWVPTCQAQWCSFRYPSGYTRPAGSPLTWWMPSTSCGTNGFPAEMSYICLQGWGPWQGLENRRDGRMHHGPLLILEAAGGAGNACGCAPWSGGTPEPTVEILAWEQCLGVVNKPVCVSSQRRWLTCFCPWLSPAFPLLIWFKTLIWYCLKATLCWVIFLQPQYKWVVSLALCHSYYFFCVGC